MVFRVVKNELHPGVQSLDATEAESLVSEASSAPRRQSGVARFANLKVDVMNVFVTVVNDALSQNMGSFLLSLRSEPPTSGMVKRGNTCGPRACNT